MIDRMRRFPQLALSPANPPLIFVKRQLSARGPILIVRIGTVLLHPFSLDELDVASAMMAACRSPDRE
jgi:hypothetical protein